MAERQPPLAERSDAELEQALLALGREIGFPATPDIASRTRQRLEVMPTPPATLPRRRGVWLAAAALLLLLLGTLALFPDARTAVADRLGLRGVQIHWLDELPTPAPTPSGASLDLGSAMTLDDAAKAVSFPLVVPTAAGFAEPSEIYLRGAGPSAMVSFVYPSGPGLPETAAPGVGALLSQFRGETERALIEKGLHSAGADPQTSLEAVTVAGERGFWITGAPHAVFFVCYGVGECRQEPARLAGNVLIWERGGVTLRLESALDKDAALAVAESVQDPAIAPE
jgi:hypothetical protein